MPLQLVQGDTAPVLTFNLNANLTGATAVAHIRRTDPTATTVVFTKSVTVGTITIGPPAVSACSVDWATGDLAYLGTHYLEVQVTFSSGKIQTFHIGTDDQSVRFTVRKQIA